MKQLKSLFLTNLSFFLSVPALLWQAIFLYIPLIIIIGYSITGFSDSSWMPHFTLTHYQTIFNVPIIGILVRSILLAVSTATLCLFIAYPLVYFLIFYAQRWRRFLLFLLILPFWTNLLVLVYAWFFVLEHNGLINTLLLKIGIISEPLQLAHSISAVFVVMVYCYLPFMIMPLYTVLEKLELRLLEASADLGATPWQTFVRVTLPLSLPGIKTGFLLVLVPAFGEFAIPALLGGSKTMMVGTLIYYYFLIARDNGLGAAFTIISGIVLILLVFVIHRILYLSYLLPQKVVEQ
jgi:spermidine/putrescine transport system permease protein